MTATTKEQRAELRRIVEEAGAFRAVHSNDGAPLIVAALSALLFDSERLAAIEAVTEEEVRELVANIAPHDSVKDLGEVTRPAGTLRKVSAALLSLSAKVAEQAGEIERLKRNWSDEERQHEQTIHDRDEAEEAVQWLDQQTGGDGEYVFSTLEPHTCICTPRRMCESIAERHYVVRAERDTLRRLLTETAVPALEPAAEMAPMELHDRPNLAAWVNAVTDRARSALSTIRAKLEGGNG